MGAPYQCEGCGNERHDLLSRQLRVIAVEEEQYEFGPAIKLQFENVTKGKKARTYKATLFKGKPLYPLGATLNIDDKVDVQGWLEVMGSDNYINIFGLKI